MRIAHVTATFPPYLAGTGNVAWHNARELARRGHEVHVYTAALEGPASAPAGVQVHRLRALMRIGNAPLLPGLGVSLRGYDLVHLHWPFIFGAELTWASCRLAGRPYVVTYHVRLLGEGGRAVLFNRYERLWGPRVLGAADAVLPVSVEHFRALANYPVRAMVEVPNGVDLEAFRPGGPEPETRSRLGLPPGASLVLFVGALDRAHHYRRLDVLLEAVAQLPPWTHLAVAGDGELRPEYCRQARDLGIGQRVHFLGRMEPGDLPAIYRASDVLALPSSEQESFGMVLIEAMACGRPVVTSDLPGVRGVVRDGENGLLVPQKNPNDLAGAIKRLLEDPGLRARLGVNGRRQVEERYDWRQIGAQLELIYAGVLSARPGPGLRARDVEHARW